MLRLLLTGSVGSLGTLSWIIVLREEERVQSRLSCSFSPPPPLSLHSLRFVSPLPHTHGAQGSPDYSEYGYEPEYELQGEDRFDADAETLAKWRLEKLLANDRWQFGKYGTQNVGNWIGECE